MSKSKKPTPRPNTLDVIKINSRWAQLIASNTIKYLDNMSVESINNWNEFNFEPAKKGREYVDELVKSGEMSSNDYWSVHYGKEPGMKGFTTVFGAYRKK